MGKSKDVEIEKSILGTILLDNKLSYKLDELNENMFMNDICLEIFKIMKELKKENIVIDVATVKSKIDRKSIAIKTSDVTNLITWGQNFGLDGHIKILKENLARRSINQNCQNLLHSLNLGENIDTCIYKFESNIKEILDKDTYENDDVNSIAGKVLDFLENKKDIGFKFGIKLLDTTIGGLFKGELTTIAAKSGVGKTALALQIMLNSFKQGKKTLFISREMTSEQVFMRNICRVTGVSTRNMKSKEIDENDWKLIVNAIGDLSENNLIYINDKIDTISAIRKRIRQVKPDLLIVDYVQLLTSQKSMDKREREVATFSRELKNMTLDFNIPVIQLSQLNDEMKDSRPYGDRPMRDSKAIYHDSNNVVYIHQLKGSDYEEAVRDIGESEEAVRASEYRGIKMVDLIVAKCRDGQTRHKHFCYFGDKLHFQELNY
ncbi:TPA: AAA family ATPase [Clostridioides difficile]|nr:AAA family ATPase [Clostridioides difficile]